jgi:hypothetical protein
MEDRRRYTGTQFLQAIWTIGALAVGAVIQFLAPIVGGLLRPAVFLSVSGVWIAGLIVIALYDRRRWSRMIDNSSFRPDTSTRLADLESLKGGRSVTVTTAIPNVLSQTHLTVQTPVEGVGASFTVRLSRVGSAGSDDGILTGNDDLDDAYVIRGTEGNVSQLLSPEIQATLMDIETVGVFTITGNAVEYEIPYTRISGDELESAADACVELAERVEQLGAS